VNTVGDALREAIVRIAASPTVFTEADLAPSARRPYAP
jgi:hypothetical protein